MAIVDNQILATLLQTGGLGVVVYLLLTQLNSTLKELTKAIYQQNTDIQVLLDRNANALEKVATESVRSRESVEHAVDVAVGKVNNS